MPEFLINQADISSAGIEAASPVWRGIMTLYEKFFDLKYRQGVPTYELAHLYPEHIERISEVALLDIPETTLREVVREKELFERLMSLKKKLRKGF